MISRIEQVRRLPESQAVHVFGSDAEQCAMACELAGSPVFRLDSGGFCAEWSAQVQVQLSSGQYRVQHEVLPWQIIEWRELGRALFKDVVVEREEDEYSRDPSWGTEEVEDGYMQELTAAIGQCAQRLKLASADEVLLMCTWRVFDRQRGILMARYGLGEFDEDEHVQQVLDAVGTSPMETERLLELRGASQAWW